MAYISFDHVTKKYQMGEQEIFAARDVSFEIEKGEFCIIVGPSGAGKTTILNILGGMDSCDGGKVLLDGREVSALDKKALTEYRRHDVGFVFQFYNLVQNLTALENVELAGAICRDPLDAAETLRSVGLGERLRNFPGQLSGGEQQRVSIARAIAKNPKILLCDEPTGALTTTPARPFWLCCRKPAAKWARRSSSSPTIRPSPPWPTASSPSRTAPSLP